MLAAKVCSLLFALPFIHAATISKVAGVDSTKPLSSIWYHQDDHPVHALFAREPTDGTEYAPIGSPTWSAGFPTSTPDSSQLPNAWVDALNAAVTAGKIPNIPQSHNTPGTNPVYPQGFDPDGPVVCSATYKTCHNKNDIWDAPTGYFATSFDDGPLPDALTLNKFLAQNNETTTYFVIGTNILANPSVFQAMSDAGHDIAVHTWTHPYMTTLSNLDVLGQLGWTIALIQNSTGGKIPKFWRPPYGDSDERVRAIAQEVFGLTTVIWNHDTEDWSLATGGTTPQWIQGNMTQWLTGPKSPGLITLEHVIANGTVQAFIDAYPLIKSNGWMTKSLARLMGDGNAYQNLGTNAQSSSQTVSSSGSTTATSTANASKASQLTTNASTSLSTRSTFISFAMLLLSCLLPFAI